MGNQGYNCCCPEEGELGRAGRAASEIQEPVTVKKKECTIESNIDWEDATSPQSPESTTTNAIINLNLELESPSRGGRGHVVDFGPPAPEASAAERREALLSRIEHLVETTYDILRAEELIAELEGLCTDAPEEWSKVTTSAMYAHFRRRLQYFQEVGHSVCTDMSSWFQVFQDATGLQTITACIDKKDPHTLEYRVKAVINASLPHCMAVANEVQLLPSWNSVVVGQPKTLGRRTAHYMVLNYQMSILGGMYKMDVLNEIRRFTDCEGGLMAEYIESVPEDHPSYCAVPSGYKRPKTKIKNVWIACGSEHTMLLQFGCLTLPFTASRWVVSTLGGLGGKVIVGGLVKNSEQAAAPGSQWEADYNKDALGLYARLRAVKEAPASKGRDPKVGADLKGDFDLTEHFARHAKWTGKAASKMAGTMTYLGSMPD